MQRSGARVAVVGALAAAVVAAMGGTALAKTTVELNADHTMVKRGQTITFSALAATDPSAAPKTVRLCLQQQRAGRFHTVGRCVGVTSRPQGVVDLFVIRLKLAHAGKQVFRALAITATGRRWTAPSRAVTITVR